MGNVLYLDCTAGIAGDMFLGAASELLDAKAAREGDTFDLASAISKIAVGGYDVERTKESRGGIAGTQVRVHTHHEHHHHDHDHDDHHEHHHHHHRNLGDIVEILDRSDFSDYVRASAKKTFTLLAEAEAAVHGTSIEEIHFHEVGAIDAIVDITGAFILHELLGRPRVVASPVNVGSGTVECAHGILPVPAPATAKLLAAGDKKIPTTSLGSPMERTTPTGAALLRALVDDFSSRPSGAIAAIGIGLGERESHAHGDVPNALRAMLIEETCNASSDECAELSCNIDDMNPQDLPRAIDALMADGALDAWIENIAMKKGRPAFKLSCLARPEDAQRLARLMIEHTTTIGVRMHTVSRVVAEREAETVETPLGPVRFKTASLDGEILRKTPEFDDLLAIAEKNKIPLAEARRKTAIQ